MPGRMKSIIQKRIIRARTQSQDKKFQTSRPCEVRSDVRSSHNICCLCSFLPELSSCRVTYENCYKSSVFSIKSDVSGIKKFQRLWVKELLLYNRIETFFENVHQKWENASCGAQLKYFQIKWVKNRSIRLKILTYESPMSSYIRNRVKLLEPIQF